MKRKRERKLKATTIAMVETKGSIDNIAIDLTYLWCPILITGATNAHISDLCDKIAGYLFDAGYRDGR